MKTFIKVHSFQANLREHLSSLGKLLALLIVFLCFAQFDLSAGSIDYLANQSADYIRSFNRNGSLEGADIVHYNPAGTAFLEQGLHLQISNQFLLKTYEIEGDLGLPISDKKFESTEPSLLLPNFFLAYNGGAWAAFTSVNITAGGGGLIYEDGVPTFNASFYSSGAAAGSTLTKNKIEATSMYISGVVGGAYSFNDMISISLGGKYVNAQKTTKVEATYTGGALAGVQKIDFEDTASGFGGIAGIDVKVNNQLNIGLRFESEITLEFEKKVNEDFTKSFKDGEKKNKDLPAVIGFGIEYKITDQFTAITTFQGYMLGFANKAEDSYSESYDALGWDAGLGLEYDVMPDFLLLSVGYMYTDVGGNEDTYSDLEFPLDAHTVGTGGKISIMKNLDFTLGIAGSFYTEEKNAAKNETFNKSVYMIGVGIEYRM